MSRQGRLTPFHLVVTFILVFLITDVRSNNVLVQSDCREKAASRLEVLTGEVLLSPAIPARNLYRALPLKVPDYILDTAYFGRMLMHM
jgi:hypothetical protein